MLSLIVTFYDETAFLRSALRSVRNQGIDDLELIVVNDNPDRFTEADLARLTTGLDARIIHHRENRGLSAARNTGIDAANGDWIGFLDADDYFTHRGLAEQLEYACETGADITHAACFLGAESSVHTSILPRDARLHMDRRVVIGHMAAQEAQFIVSSWSSLYRSDFLARNELWFDPEQRKFEDRLFVLNAATAARKIAFLGRAVRVWRRRAGSISSTAMTHQTHVYQVQLLEKCMAHMRAACADSGLPPRFEKRELFNTVSRLIWDMDILERLATDNAQYADLGARIVALLGNDSFGQEIFDDPMIVATSRVGMQTRRGLITRADFFEIHKAMRDGAFANAHALMKARATVSIRPQSAAAHPQKRLILHIGLHKTGTTFIQHHLRQHRNALKHAGVLVPETGFDSDVLGRAGALSGHQGLVRALRHDDDAPWRALHEEIVNSPARTVVLSAENLGFPTAPNRHELIATLFDRLGTFSQIDVIAMVRAPHRYAEAFYGEWVTTAHPGGARSLAETLVDHGDNLTNLAALFAPFETATGRRVSLGDFDRLRRGAGIWPGFCGRAGLPANLPELDVPRYPSPDRESIQLMQLINTMVTSRSRRQRLMQAYFADPSRACNDNDPLMSPEQARDLIDRFETTSADFCATRGYAPDIGALRQSLDTTPWSPPTAIPLETIRSLIDACVQIAGENPSRSALQPLPGSAQKSTRSRYSFVIRPRPWAVKLLDKILGKT